ncbi:MAG: hypothetical protein ABR559_07095 [Gemmatimonadota bacterium]
MPNGGSDCCGTCWFNAKNKGDAGYKHTDDPEPDVCQIRQLPIDNPFYTYCANHPHRNPERLKVPIGPVYTGDSDGNREVWVASPDTQEVRANLLRLLAGITESPPPEYPFGPPRDRVVIWQLGEFREERAVPDLIRIRGFRLFADSQTWDSAARLRQSELAHEALNKIEGSQEPPA